MLFLTKMVKATLTGATEMKQPEPVETCLDWEVERNHPWRQQESVPTVSLQATANWLRVLEQLGMNLEVVDEIPQHHRSLGHSSPAQAARAVPRG